MDMNKRLELLKAIFNFIKSFKPFLTEQEFIQQSSNKDEIEIVKDQFELIEKTPPTTCRWSFILSSLTLVIEVGNYPVNHEKYSHEEAIQLFERILIDDFLKLSKSELSCFYEAYALSHNELNLDKAKEIYINYGGGDIANLEVIDENRFKLMKEKLIGLCQDDINNFIKAIFAIEMSVSDQETLNKALEIYLTSNQPLINPDLIKGDEKL